jgi:phospholipid/cholesterol/gamma-HCH transport system permease protein
VISKLVNFVGKTGIKICNDLGDIGAFLFDTVKVLFSTKLKMKKFFYSMNYIGVNSLSVVALVGITGGAVLALQSYIGLERFGASRFIGPIIYLSMTREFGPVFTAIMVIGRAGSAITAEIGTMRITEQIDALQTLCINTKQYLVVPRLLAGMCILPFLSICCSLFGIVSGYVVSIFILGINSEVYMDAVRVNAELSDITSGLIKAVVFGFLLTLISTYKGFTTTGGAKGVGVSTTQSVVYSNVTIFVANYILTSLLFSK